MSTTALQPHHLANLIAILHDANKRYHIVADTVRCSRTTPTHHARKRAQKLGLAIDIESAIACPQRQISNVPLPIIDSAITPIMPIPTIRLKVPPKCPTIVIPPIRGRGIRAPIALHPSGNIPWKKIVLDVPSDEDECVWEDLDLSPATSSSSFGPVTPLDDAPPIIRSKRKSVELEDRSLDKRPKFVRKDWSPRFRIVPRKF